MVIKKIEVGAFGKLEGYSMDFNDGVQVIYGPNEFGKSTIMEFLKMMFYSKRGVGRSNSEDKILRQRYMPWSGLRMKGSVEFTYSGSLYKIQKEISSESPKKDVALIINKSTGQTLELGKNEEAGERFFGVDIKSFERSSYIKNIGKSDFEKSKDSKDHKDSLADKILSNLSDTGESDTSKSLVTRRLDEAIKDLQWSRGNGGKIFRVQDLINETNQKIYDLKLFEENRSELLKKLSEIKNLRKELSCLQSEVENAEKSHRLSKINRILELIKNKEKQIENLNVPFHEARFIIERLTSEKKEVENHLTKVRELQNIANSANKNILPISLSEVNELNLKLCEKENLESNINELNCFLKSQDLEDKICDLKQNTRLFDMFGADFYHELSGDLNEYKKFKADLEQFKEKGVSLEISTKTTESKILSDKEKLDKISADFKTGKSRTVFFEIANLFIMIASLCAGIFMNIPAIPVTYALLFVVFCGCGWLYLKNIKKNINSAADNVRDLQKDYNEKCMRELSDNQAKISNALISAGNIESKVQKKLSGRFEAEKASLAEVEKIISEMLRLKNCSSAQDYYEKYAEFQSNSKIQTSYREALKKFKNIESNFINDVSKYFKARDFSEAVIWLKNSALRNSEIETLEREIKLELSALGLENSGKEFLSEYAESLHFEINEKTKLSLDELEEARKRIGFLKSLGLEEKYIEIQKSIKDPTENTENLSKILFEQKAKFSDMKIYLESLQVALSAIEESSDELRKNFNPELNARASEIFSCLTNGKYNRLHVGKDYGILVNNDMIDRGCDSFSSGTVDQAYLALRIAVSEMISGKDRPPLILDDIFMQYDNSRLNNALEFLKEYSLNKSGCQVIIFTCHKYVADIESNKDLAVVYAD